MVQQTKDVCLENNDENYWGYFSLKQLISASMKNREDKLNKEFRANYYYTANGGEVLISEVSKSDPLTYHNNFNDVIKLGKIGKWKRSVPISEVINLLINTNE
tara:strand:+ start:11504 stop:11812 length:309 start_codon:yes stop_codon:yes gene_type:complete